MSEGEVYGVRKPVSICYDPGQSLESGGWKNGSLVAICDDGTVWRKREKDVYWKPESVVGSVIPGTAADTNREG